jgi:hypothetical protein
MPRTYQQSLKLCEQGLLVRSLNLQALVLRLNVSDVFGDDL